MVANKARQESWSELRDTIGGLIASAGIDILRARRLRLPGHDLNRHRRHVHRNLLTLLVKQSGRREREETRAAADLQKVWPGTIPVLSMRKLGWELEITKGFCRASTRYHDVGVDPAQQRAGVGRVSSHVIGFKGPNSHVHLPKS